MLGRRTLRNFFSKKPDTNNNVSALKKEIRNNPYFDQAFPHLAKYKEPTEQTIERKELGYIQSLL